MLVVYGREPLPSPILPPKYANHRSINRIVKQTQHPTTPKKARKQGGRGLSPSPVTCTTCMYHVLPFGAATVGRSGWCGLPVHESPRSLLFENQVLFFTGKLKSG